MTTWFITRHHGATEWAKQQGLNIDRQLSHLDLDDIEKGDLVIGILPVNLIAELNQKNARYLHLVLPLPKSLRGQEISAAMMTQLGARLEEYQVKRIQKITNNSNHDLREN